MNARQERDPDAWARFVSSDSYQASHLLGSTGGWIAWSGSRQARVAPDLAAAGTV